MSTNTWRLIDAKTASKCILFVFGVSLTTIYVTNYLFPTSVYADNPEVDQVNITVPVSCTLDGIGMNSHTANINNRDYETEIGSTTLTAYCNDTNGFSIYAIGYSNDEYGNTDMIGINTEELIHTGTTLDGTISNWAMKLSTDPNATYPVEIQNSYNNYKVVPTTYTLVVKRESSTDLGTAAIGSILTTTYAASVSPTQVADTYIGKVRYTLVHPYNEIPPTEQSTDSGKICYYPNTAIYEGTMGCQTIGTTTGTTSTSATLLASNYSKNGYGFAGWSDVPDYTTNTNAKFYGPQEDITFTEGEYGGTNPGLSLYAVWVPSAGHFQDSGRVAELCGSGANALTQAPTDGTADLSSVSALTDLRDNQIYAIAKLADGNCWMIENLRLENTAEHNSDGSLAQGYGASVTYGNFNGLANPESTGFSDTYSANSLYSNDGSNNTISIGANDYPALRMPRYNNLNTPENANNRPQNPDSNSFTNDNTTVGMYSYGNYYTWHAAIADLVYNGTNNNSSNTTSLCPAGWRIPKGGDKTRITSNNDNELWNLIVTGINDGVLPANYDSQNRPFYTDIPEGSDVSNKLRAYPNNYLISGVYFTSSASGRGTYGYYWSSTASSSSNSYYLYISNAYVLPGTDSNYKRYGFSIRCLTPGA